MLLLSEDHAEELSVLDIGGIKKFVEEHGNFEVFMYENDIIRHGDLMCRWILLVYLVSISDDEFDQVKWKIVKLFSITKEEYLLGNTKKKMFIHIFFSQCEKYKLTDRELWILQHAIFEYEPGFSSFLEHVQYETKVAIESNKIPIEWVKQNELNKVINHFIGSVFGYQKKI